MAIRKLVLIVALALVALPGLVIADHEHRVTVLMRNGDRVSGLLEDVEQGTVFIRASLHDQRKLPLGDVLLIDLVGGASGLPDTELSVAARSEHLVVLRNGSSMTGSFVDVRGGEATAAVGEPHVLIFRAGNDQRNVGLDQVSRIYFGNYPFTQTQTAAPQPINPPNNPVPAGSISVPGTATWVPTGLVVRKGDSVAFNVTGRVQLSDDPGDIAEAAGSHRGRLAPGAPLPNALAGALIAKIGNSAPFAIGNQSSMKMPYAGQLFLGINDDGMNDNRGEFIVQMSAPGWTRR